MDMCVEWVDLNYGKKLGGSLMKRDWAERLWFQNDIYLSREKMTEKRENEYVYSKTAYKHTIQAQGGRAEAGLGLISWKLWEKKQDK